ncbi:GntR family transcriptional regulator [Kitasatospora sp. NPDC048540]|uniref:FadR/GntR family transcriptional regulator n=1 Tax=Kitasatospora sp. NPDC048540 TaxID=3155634 RepID=UPI00340C0CA5
MADFTVVRRTALSDAVFDQIANRILDGTLPAGSSLPPERSLTETFGVNRQALREALQRLSQLGLVEIRHGESTRVRDFRTSAGLDLVPHLLQRTDGTIDPLVVRAMTEMRSAVGADAAALCAARAGEAEVRALRDVLSEFSDPDGESRPTADIRFWDLVVDGSGNICYRLALNGMRALYRRAEPLVRNVLATERSAVHLYGEVVEAISDHDPERARSRAALLLEHGAAAMNALFPGSENR